jgi:hypothetical protein
MFLSLRRTKAFSRNFGIKRIQVIPPNPPIESSARAFADLVLSLISRKVRFCASSIASGPGQYKGKGWAIGGLFLGIAGLIAGIYIGFSIISSI